ncbi:MAG: HRDC domain-containing protein [Elusimicrobiota bacterium]
MTGKEPSPPRIIESIQDLESLAADLKGEPRVAIDMESDSFYVYHEKVCLLQLSTGEEDFVIDPLAVKDISPLGPLFRDPAIEKVFHAGEYDIVCLKRDYGFVIKHIFDTMVAARTLGMRRLGLAPLIDQHFGVKLSKKLQRANWGKRPLTPEHIEYARNDTHYLLALRDALAGELERKALRRDATDEFRRLEKLQPVAREFDADAFWYLHGARDLPAQGKAVLRRLYVFREKTAAELDRAPFRVLPEELLVRLAERCPKSIEAMRGMKGMSPYLFRRFGRELIREIDKGRAAPPIEAPAQRPKRDQWDADTMRRCEALRQWRKKTAVERGVDPVVILPTEEVRQLALAPRQNPDTDHWINCISEYKRELYGKDILAILKQPQPARKKKRRSRRARSGAQRTEQKL